MIGNRLSYPMTPAGRRLSAIPRFALLLLLLLPAHPAHSQSPPPTVLRPRQPLPTVRVNPGSLSINPQGQIDQFDQMVGSSASIDLDSPVTVRAEFEPATAALGQRITYRLILSALDESVEKLTSLPAPPGLKLSAGGRAQSYQPGPTGRLQPQTTLNFRATATATGEFVVPAFTIKAYGKDVAVPAARLTVTAPGTLVAPEAPHLLFELPAGDVYVGQSLRVSLILPDSADGSLQGPPQQPAIVGEAIFVEPQALGARHELIQRNGRSFPAYVMEMVFTPVREGRQTLVAQVTSYGRRPVPGQPGAIQFAQILLDSDPLEMTVLPLPKEGVLPGFTGAIGNYQVDAPVISTNEVVAGEVIVLNMHVRGEGNLGRLTPPKLSPLREWMTYPPITESAPPMMIQQRGYANFSYTLIPLSDRVKATPAIPFCCFDPKRKVYVDLTIPPVPITVHPVAAGAAMRSPGADGGTGVNAAETAAREHEPILSGLVEHPGPGAGALRAGQESGWFWAAQLLPAAILAGITWRARRRRYLAAHPAVLRQRRARRGLRRQLQVARRAAAARDARGYVAGAISAMREACAPHGAANPDSLVCADILRELPAEDRVGPGAEMVRRFFAAADSLRYGGPVNDGAELLARQPELEQLLKRLGARI